MPKRLGSRLRKKLLRANNVLRGQCLLLFEQFYRIRCFKSHARGFQALPDRAVHRRLAPHGGAQLVAILRQPGQLRFERGDARCRSALYRVEDYDLAEGPPADNRFDLLAL